MLVSVYLCKNLNPKRAAAGSESAGDAVLPKENAARLAKNAGQKNGCLRKCRKVPERFVAGVGVAGKRMRQAGERRRRFF